MSWNVVTLSFWRNLTRFAAVSIFSVAILAAGAVGTRAQAITEGFDDVTTLIPQGWFVQNNSVPTGTFSWIQGSPGPSTFESNSGAPNSYVAVTYLSVTGQNTISNWLLTPNRTFSNGDQIKFFTRTVSPSEFPDRMQVRLSTAGSSTNVGSGPEGLGDFTTLLLDINPTYSLTGYPLAWTEFTITLSNLPGGAASGRIAFRYYVEDSGPLGNNGDYIGIDDFRYIPGAAAPLQHVVDFNGDGKTDYTVSRNNDGNRDWYTTYGGVIPPTFQQFGLQFDIPIPVDFDGDQKSDIAVWRPGAATQAQFLILRSTTSTIDTIPFGQTNDDPSITADYTGDGKADPAIFRNGVWWYLASSGPLEGTQVAVNWGQTGDFPAPGDYDGDGKADFCVQRNIGGAGTFIMIPGTGAGASGTPVYTSWGLPSDVIVPGDYDGDGKTDIAVVRGVAGNINWYIKGSNGTDQIFTWGVAATDFPTQGDYDGDGKTDVAVWRGSVESPTASGFWIYSSSGSPFFLSWGLQGDYPVANYNTH